jgi:hypothetical protein
MPSTDEVLKITGETEASVVREKCSQRRILKLASVPASRDQNPMLEKTFSDSDSIVITANDVD